MLGSDGFPTTSGVDHALAVLDTIMGRATEWNVEVWCASLDLRKSFDPTLNKPPFDALRCQGALGCYVHFLDAPCCSQLAQWKEACSSVFRAGSNKVMSCHRRCSMLVWSM